MIMANRNAKFKKNKVVVLFFFSELSDLSGDPIGGFQPTGCALLVYSRYLLQRDAPCLIKLN